MNKLDFDDFIGFEKEIEMAAESSYGNRIMLIGIVSFLKDKIWYEVVRRNNGETHKFSFSDLASAIDCYNKMLEGAKNE